MKDRIQIKNLECYGYHGVLAEEQRLGQPFIFDISLFLDTSIAAKGDDLSKTANYAKICQYIKNYMEQEHCKLIETVAEQLTRGILLHFPLVEEITLTIKKPQAPIPMNFETVQVTISRKWHSVYLGVGSNMGDKKKQIETAIAMFQQDENCRNLKSSTLYTTKPYGMTEQDEFINGAFYVETLYTPEELLSFIQTIEQELHRIRTIHWGPRTIDVDILLYDEETIHTENLCIPHMEMAQRDFVLIPLQEIAPYAYHPVYKKTVSELFHQLKANPHYVQTVYK